MPSGKICMKSPNFPVDYLKNRLSFSRAGKKQKGAADYLWK